MSNFRCFNTRNVSPIFVLLVYKVSYEKSCLLFEVPFAKMSDLSSQLGANDACSSLLIACENVCFKPLYDQNLSRHGSTLTPVTRVLSPTHPHFSYREISPRIHE